MNSVLAVVADRRVVNDTKLFAAVTVVGRNEGAFGRAETDPRSALPY